MEYVSHGGSRESRERATLVSKHFSFFWNPLLLLSLLLLPPGDKAPKHHLSAMYRLAIGPSVLT